MLYHCVLSSSVLSSVLSLLPYFYLVIELTLILGFTSSFIH